VAEYGKSDEGGTGEASGQNDIQSFDELSRTPSEDHPDELEVKDTTDTRKSASYLDLHNAIDNGGR
jgi:hypothetical protein